MAKRTRLLAERGVYYAVAHKEPVKGLILPLLERDGEKLFEEIVQHGEETLNLSELQKRLLTKSGATVFGRLVRWSLSELVRDGAVVKLEGNRWGLTEFGRKVGQLLNAQPTPEEERELTEDEE